MSLDNSPTIVSINQSAVKLGLCVVLCSVCVASISHNNTLAKLYNMYMYMYVIVQCAEPKSLYL